MNKEAAKQAIVEAQEAALPELVSRELVVPLDSPKVIAISGVRRSGKTYLLYSLMHQLRAQGVPARRLIYFNFENPNLLPASGADLESLAEAYHELYASEYPETKFLFLDEIQQVDDWEIGVRRLQDMRTFRIFLTGSSARLLSRDLASSLRGRAVGFEVMPFSVREFLRAQGMPVTPATVYSRDRFRLKQLLADYLATGGFPEVALEPDPTMKVRILKEYVETMFLRDLIERHGVRNSAVMRELLKFLVSSSGRLFSANATWKWLRGVYPLTKRTLLQYASHLEESGLIHFVRKFDFSLKEQSLRPRKTYVVDIGIRTAYGFSFSQDRGAVLENAVFLALRQWQLQSPILELFYWQNGKNREVDFVVRQGKATLGLVQVSADPRNPATHQREIAPLLSAMEELKLRESLVVTEDYSNTEKHGRCRIRYVPFWKWVLQSREGLIHPG